MTTQEANKEAIDFLLDTLRIIRNDEALQKSIGGKLQMAIKTEISRIERQK